jgi:hypothetical protein
MNNFKSIISVGNDLHLKSPSSTLPDPLTIDSSPHREAVHMSDTMEVRQSERRTNHINANTTSAEDRKTFIYPYIYIYF